MAVHNQELFRAIERSVIDGLAVIATALDSGQFIARYYEFPKMEVFEQSGMPSFRKSTIFESDNPLDFTSVFRSVGEKASVMPESWKDAFLVSARIPRVREYFGFDYFDTAAAQDPHGIAAGRNEWSIQWGIEKLIERYIHVTGLVRYHPEAFVPIYHEWENSIFAERLDFDIYVPILFVRFGFDHLEFPETEAMIRRIPETLQLARNTQHSYTIATHKQVIGAATHALVLEDWHIENQTDAANSATLHSVEAFSEAFEKVDSFFASLRIETGVETGYSQVVIVPKGWGDYWQAHLPRVFVLSTREYPDRFEHYRWLEPTPELSSIASRDVLRAYRMLIGATDNKLSLARKRLNTAYLRRDENDSILDITIALETLLADDSHGEIVHRLAMRIGALASLAPFEAYSPDAVFQICKKVYDFRSAVVHGGHQTSKKRLVKIPSEPEPIPALSLGIVLLRYVIKTILAYPELLDPKRIDKYLLTRRL